MKSIIARLIFLSSVASAVLIPDGHKDGVWIVTENEPTPHYLGPVEPSKRSAELPTKVLAARGLPNPTVGCNGYNVNSADSLAAHNAFDNYINGGTYYNQGTTIGVAVGSAVAYMCVYNGAQRGWGSEYDLAVELIKTNCGKDGAGWVNIPSYGKRYGRSNVGANIC
ncbi:hypothetical protein GQ53DRAFT_3531 [Thozetella sp. PMI_491]|nr:hypothetical protein GQ53DRAFT_3531 [Thozetella sp. PMI_491]